MGEYYNARLYTTVKALYNIRAMIDPVRSWDNCHTPNPMYVESFQQTRLGCALGRVYDVVDHQHHSRD